MYKFRCSLKMESDFIPNEVANQIFENIEIGTAIEFMPIDADPKLYPLEIVEVGTGNVVWSSATEEFEEEEDYF